MHNNIVINGIHQSVQPNALRGMFLISINSCVVVSRILFYFSVVVAGSAAKVL